MLNNEPVLWFGLWYLSASPPVEDQKKPPVRVRWLWEIFWLLGIYFCQPNPKFAMAEEHDHEHNKIDVKVNAG